MDAAPRSRGQDAAEEANSSNDGGEGEEGVRKKDPDPATTKKDRTADGIDDFGRKKDGSMIWRRRRR
jgi:hypothetical protein